MTNERLPTLAVDGLSVHYGAGHKRRQVISDVSFDIARGEAVGVIGETGSGKSTIARTIVGLVRPSAGRIVIASNDVTDLRARQRRAFRRHGGVQYVFQDPLRSLDPDRTIRDSLREPLQLQRRLGTEQIDAQIERRIDQVRLSSRLLSRYPGELSGGQRQRAVIARALVTSPELLIMDEPVSALDAANRVGVLELLNELRGDDLSIMFISHDLGSVVGVTDRVLVLYGGEVVESGPTREVVRNPRSLYSKLLVGSAPTLATGSVDRATRAQLRRELEAR